MTFQTVIDNAQTISINKRRKVSVTASRDGTVKTLSLGSQPWTFEVQMPNGPQWTTMRPLIERLEYLDRTTVGSIRINKSTHSWINGYQGNLSNPNAVTVLHSTTSSNSLTIASGAGGLYAGQFRFKAGDLIQLGSTGSVYSVAADVPYNGTTITTHRPIREATTSTPYSLLVGQSVTWNVICTSFPQWSLVSRNQISWSGPFVFVEAL